MTCLRVRWLGRNVSYETGLSAMKQATEAFYQNSEKAENTLFLLEHEDVITTTRQGGNQFLRSDEAALKKDRIKLALAARGGDVTFHGRGQLVGYPVVRLPFLKDPPAGRVDILHYLRTLENALVQACLNLGLRGVHTQKEMTGVWIHSPILGPENEINLPLDDAKMIAIGVGVKRGVTRHGFAFNLQTPLEHFTQHLVPCGLENEEVTSLDRVWAEQKTEELPSLRTICQSIAANLAQGLSLKAPPQADFEPIPESLAP